MKKTILIVGITSFVGSNLVDVLSESFNVVGTYFSHYPKISGNTQLIKCDVLNKEDVRKVIKFSKPDYVIYAVGVSSLNTSNELPKLAEELNTTGAVNCLNACGREGALFIYLSSAYVQSGDNKLFKEADTPFPNSVLGTTIANAEFYIQRTSLNYLILRCPVLYGHSYSGTQTNVFELLQKSQFTNRKLRLDDHINLGFLDVHLLARFIKILLDKKITNRLLHISSVDHMTTYQFGEKYLSVFGGNPALLEISEDALSFDLKKASQTISYKLDIANAESRIGIKMPTIKESLEFSYKRINVKNS